MVDSKRPALRPMRINRPVNSSDGDGDLPPMPRRVPQRPVAPDRVSQTESDQPTDARNELWITLDPGDKEGIQLILDLIDHITSDT